MSRDAKFTPGPWEVTSSPTQIGECFRVMAEGILGSGHGEIILYNDSTSLNPHGVGVVKANAHLVAAAPEMYEALKLAEVLLDHAAVVVNTEAVQHYLPGDFKQRVMDFVSRNVAGSALAKAEGRQA